MVDMIYKTGVIQIITDLYDQPSILPSQTFALSKVDTAAADPNKLKTPSL